MSAPEIIMALLVGVTWGAVILVGLYAIWLGGDGAKLTTGILAVAAVFITVLFIGYHNPPTYHIYIKES